MGEEGDQRQQSLYERILLPMYDVIVHLCQFYTDRLIVDNRAKFTVVVRGRRRCGRWAGGRKHATVTTLRTRALTLAMGLGAALAHPRHPCGSWSTWRVT